MDFSDQGSFSELTVGDLEQKNSHPEEFKTIFEEISKSSQELANAGRTLKIKEEQGILAEIAKKTDSAKRTAQEPLPHDYDMEVDALGPRSTR